MAPPVLRPTRRVGPPLIGKALALVLLANATIVRADEYDDAPPPPLPAPTPTKPSASAPTPVVPAAVADTIRLRSGVVYRGRVTEVVTNDHITVILPGGETKRFAWAELDQVVVASIPPPTEGKPSIPTPPLDAPFVGPVARVHVDSPRRVVLYRRAATTGNWVQACISPCDVDLPLGDQYRLAGNGIPETKPFSLQGRPGGGVVVKVDPPNTGGLIGGGIVAGLGLAAMQLGALLAAAGIANEDLVCGPAMNKGFGGAETSSADCIRRRDRAPDVRDAGFVTLAAGVAVAGAGILIFALSLGTDVTTRAGGGGKEASAKAPLDAYVRSPTFRGVASSAEAGAPSPGAAFPMVLRWHF